VIQMAEGRKNTMRTNKGKRTNTIGQLYRVMAYLWAHPQQTMELSAPRLMDIGWRRMMRTTKWRQRSCIPYMSRLY